MAYPVRDGKGVTYIKDSDNVWKPLRGLWQKTDSSTWTPVVRANLKVNSTTWESVYPAPQGYLLASPSSLTFTPFQYHTEPDNDLDGDVNGAPVGITLQNTGDDDLIIQSITVNNAAGYSVATTHTALPFTILTNQSSSLTARVKGLTVGSYSGNIQIQANTGVLGNVVTTIPLSVTVRPDYGDISVRPYPINLVKYTTESASPQTITVTNTGNGANLIITSNTIANGYVTRSNLPAQIGYNFSTFSGNSSTFTMTVANLAEGNYTDTLTIYNNSGNRPDYEVPINISVTTPRGLREFSTPGTYTWTVPDYVHQINLLTVAAGGGGGPGVSGVLEGGSGGGGGSGGYEYSTNIAVVPGETLTVTVGGGGGNKNRPIAIYHPVSNGAWSGFMNTYAVWTHPDGVTPTNQTTSSTRIFTSPAAGYYRFLVSADNYLDLLVDNILVASTSSFTSTTTVNVYLNQGSHPLTLNAVNYGGPAGFAVVIQNSNGDELWNTRTLLDPSGGDTGETTTVTGSFGTISVTGGLGGGAAYNSGASYSGGDGGTTGGDNGGQTDSGGGGGGGCFLPHTLIKMADGTEKKISSIRVGDYVLEALTNKPVKVIGVKTRPHDITKWVFALHDDEMPYITEEHPWYNDDDELCAISTLCTEQAPWLGNVNIVEVKNKIKLSQDVIVYNLILETGESHYANGIRVNNIVKNGGTFVLVYKGLLSQEAYQNHIWNETNSTVSPAARQRFFVYTHKLAIYVLENDNFKSRVLGQVMAWAVNNRSSLEPIAQWWFKSSIRKLIFGKQA